MWEPQSLPVRTASPEDSIWRGIGEQPFRENIVALQSASNRIHGCKTDVSGEEWEKRRSKLSSVEYSLPFAVEQQISGDIAYLAACTQGAQGVSAVCLEEDLVNGGVIVRLAANDTVSLVVQIAVKEICDILIDCAHKRLSRRNVLTALLDRVIILNRARIHARLRSSQWKRPLYCHRDKSKSTLPLYEEINRISAKIRRLSCCCSSFADTLCAKLDNLASLYRTIDSVPKGTEEELDGLKDITQESNGVYHWWAAQLSKKNDRACCFSKAPIRQVGKIGRYWSLCLNLSHFPRKHRDLCARIRPEILPPFQKGTSDTSKKTPVRCCVHPEMQLMAFYESDYNATRKRPRVIGASKPSCYLCHLFIRCHGGFFLSETNWRLQEGWTVPDLDHYDPLGRDRIRKTLLIMNKNLKQRVLVRDQHLRSFSPTSQSDVQPFSPTPSTSARSSTASLASSSSRSLSTYKSSASAASSTTALTSVPPSPAQPVMDSSLSMASSSSGQSTCVVSKEELAQGQDLDETMLLNVLAKNVRMTFEIDGAGRGRVSLGLKPPCNGCRVDAVVMLDRINPGSTIVVERKPGCDSVLLELRYGSRKPLFALLQWI